jgi:hypothetical protein
MARRVGKAAARKSRQRRVQRSASRPAPAPAPASPPASDVAAEAGLPAAIPTARRTAPPAPATVASSSSAGSTLSLRERAEYHYVERDLRNIGILTLIMVVLLVAAWFAFRALGLIS